MDSPTYGAATGSFNGGGVDPASYVWWRRRGVFLIGLMWRVFGCATAGTAAPPAMAHAQCACICPANGAPFFRSAVPRDVEPTPPNARIFMRLARYDVASVELTSQSVTPVPFVLEPAGDSSGTAFWLEPLSPLDSGRYVLSAIARASGTVYRQQLVVEGDNDTTPPMLEGVDVVGRGSPNYCHDVVGAVVVWAPVSADVLRSDLVVEVELWRESTMLARVFPEDVALDGTTTFGTSEAADCFGAAHAEGLRAGEELTARVRVWDQAGNATDVGTFPFVPVPSRAADAGPCGRYCGAAPWSDGRPPVGWAAIMIVTVCRSRARRRHRGGASS